MSKAFIDDTNLTDIADAIRSKLGVSDTYPPSEMAGAIQSIPKRKVVDFNITPKTLNNAEQNSLQYVKAYGKCEQNGTPVIIVYPLATPTTESVTDQSLQVEAGDNTLEITQSSLPNLEVECEYFIQ